MQTSVETWCAYLTYALDDTDPQQRTFAHTIRQGATRALHDSTYGSAVRAGVDTIGVHNIHTLHQVVGVRVKGLSFVGDVNLTKWWLPKNVMCLKDSSCRSVLLQVICQPNQHTTCCRHTQLTYWFVGNAGQYMKLQNQVNADIYQTWSSPVVGTNNQIVLSTASLQASNFVRYVKSANIYLNDQPNCIIYRWCNLLFCATKTINTGDEFILPPACSKATTSSSTALLPQDVTLRICQ